MSDKKLYSYNTYHKNGILKESRILKDGTSNGLIVSVKSYNEKSEKETEAYFGIKRMEKKYIKHFNVGEIKESFVSYYNGTQGLEIIIREGWFLSQTSFLKNGIDVGPEFIFSETGIIYKILYGTRSEKYSSKNGELTGIYD
jgi:hypothetical protein